MGEGSRTTTDFELDFNRAWNSILDSGQPRGMNEIRIRFIFPNSGVGRAMMLRSSHFTESEIQSVTASILCITEKNSAGFYSLQILESALTFCQRNLETPRHFNSLKKLSAN